MPRNLAASSRFTKRVSMRSLGSMRPVVGVGHWCRAAWHPFGGFVDLVDQQRVALPGATSEVLIPAPDHQTSRWKQEQQQVVAETNLGDPVKRLHEQVRRHSGEHARGRAERSQRTTCTQVGALRSCPPRRAGSAGRSQQLDIAAGRPGRARSPSPVTLPGGSPGTGRATSTGPARHPTAMWVLTLARRRRGLQRRRPQR